MTKQPPGGFESQTSTTLLRGLRDVDDAERFESSWRQFHGKYAVIIARWCQASWNLNATTADDVAADVMVRVLRTIRRFQYRRTGSFRAWMYTVTRRAVIDYWKSEPRGPHVHDVSVLDNLQAREDLVKRLHAEFDLELLAEARRRVEQSVSSRDWTIFVALTEHDHSPLELAGIHQITRNNVDNIKFRVLKALREQICLLEANGIDP